MRLGFGSSPGCEPANAPADFGGQGAGIVPQPAAEEEHPDAQGTAQEIQRPVHDGLAKAGSGESDSAEAEGNTEDGGNGHQTDDPERDFQSFQFVHAFSSFLCFCDPVC